MSINLLRGLTLTRIENKDNEELLFHAEGGRVFRMWHDQDCCECVTLNEVVGDLGDLIGAPILDAEEVSNSSEPSPHSYTESHTWTFYKLWTIKGSVTLRWLGESNGYYSESVDFAEIGGGAC